MVFYKWLYNKQYCFVVLLLIIQLFIVFLNFHHQKEQSIVSGHYVPYADWIKGTGDRQILTYPMWGYPAIIALLGSTNAVLFVQAFFSVLVLYMAYIRSCSLFPLPSRTFMFLFMFPLPWYFLHAVRWATSPAVLLGTCSLVLLSKNRLVLSIIAGVLMGLSFNFRSDWLGIPLVLSFVSLVHFKSNKLPVNFFQVFVFTALSYLMLIPWLIFSSTVSNYPSLTSSNSGMVAFITLGQLPSNPWGVIHEDSYARVELEKRGYVDVAPYSSEGSRVLGMAWRESIKAHPVAFVKKCVVNFAVLVAGGFYMGELPLNAADMNSVAEARESIRDIIHGRFVDVHAIHSNAAAIGVGYFVLSTIAGVVYIIFTIVGMFTLKSSILSDSWLYISFVVILYIISVSIVLQAQPRHMNPIYVFAIVYAISGFNLFRKCLLFRKYFIR